MEKGVLAQHPTGPAVRKKISPEVRAHILHRDNYKCQNPECPSGYVPREKLHIHHWNHDKSDNRITNLITSCVVCNNRSKALHYQMKRKLNHLYASLRKYKTDQLSFHFE